MAAMFIITTADAEVIKPNNKIDPYEVVKIQLNSLMKNDDPYKDNGIKQTWEFAHPNNQKYTGPLPRFKVMLKGESYKMLLNHLDHKIVIIKETIDVADYQVTVLAVSYTHLRAHET